MSDVKPIECQLFGGPRAGESIMQQYFVKRIVIATDGWYERQDPELAELPDRWVYRYVWQAGNFQNEEW